MHFKKCFICRMGKRFELDFYDYSSNCTNTNWGDVTDACGEAEIDVNGNNHLIFGEKILFCLNLQT
jgi:hypothetical protein